MDNREEAIQAFLHATELMKQSKLEEALEIFYSVEKFLSEVPALYYNKSQIFVRQDNLGTALENIEIALSLDPNNVKYLILNFEITQKLRNFKDAIKIAESIITLEPRQDVATNLAFIYLRQDEPDKAEELFEDLILQGQAGASIYFVLGILKYQSNQLGDAVDLLIETINREYQVKDAINVLISAYEKQERVKDAINFLEEYDDISPKLNFQLAKLYKKDDRSKLAETIIDNLLQINPNDTEYITFKAHLLRERGLYNEAISLYDKLLEKNNEDLSAIKGKALSLVELDQYDEANALFEKGQQLRSGGQIQQNEHKAFDIENLLTRDK